MSRAQPCLGYPTSHHPQQGNDKFFIISSMTIPPFIPPISSPSSPAPSRLSHHFEQGHLAVFDVFAGRHQQAEAALDGERRQLLARLAHGHGHLALGVTAQLEAALVTRDRRVRALANMEKRQFIRT